MRLRFARRKRGAGPARHPARRDVSVAFAELHGAVAAEIEEDVDLVFAVLNRCLGIVTPAFERSGGIADVQDGVTVMALWNAEGCELDHAENALAACLEAAAGIAADRDAALQRGDVAQSVSIGLESGPANVGVAGGGDHGRLVALGATVGRALRLTAWARRLGCAVAIGPGAAPRLAERYLPAELDSVVMKGFSEAVPIFEAVAERGSASQAQRAYVQAYAEALSAYRRGDFSAARDLWGSMDRPGTAGPPAGAHSPPRVMAERAAAYVEQAPARPWDGIWFEPGPRP